MLKRPKLGESEEDLLKLQEEFYKDKLVPSAKLIKKNDYQSTSNDVEMLPAEKIEEKLHNTFEDIPKTFNLGNIVERDSPGTSVYQFKCYEGVSFPRAKRLDAGNIPEGKGSLFSRQMKLQKPTNEKQINLPSPSNLKTTEKNPLNIPEQSYIITGDVKDDVHKENVNVLSKMSEEEILEERKQLIETMDPAIIAFLKSKRAQSKEPFQNRQPTMQVQKQAVENMDVEEIEVAKDLLNKPEREQWLNFNTLEKDKLAWMKDVDVPRIDKNSQYEARFDFDGWLLPFTLNEIDDKNRALYHHGEEPGRPGYTLQELFQLSRSSVLQQKIVALNTIGNILNLQSTGVYDRIIEIPLEQIFFVIRFCLDENSPGALNASIKAMRNLFYYTIDETCLDSTLNFGINRIQPVLAIDPEEIDDDKTVNDQQLAESNLVKCLARTDILVRIRYIFNTVKPDSKAVIHCFEILIRLIRDSNFIAKQVYNCDGLLESIMQNFLSNFDKSQISTDQVTIGISAFKFLRLLCVRGKDICANLVNKIKILEVVIVILSNTNIYTQKDGLKLQIEAFNLFSVVLYYDLGYDYLSTMDPILKRLLLDRIQVVNISKTSNLIQAHIASLLNMLVNCVKNNFNLIEDYINIIVKYGFPKWCSEFSRIENYSCGKLQLISAVLEFLSAIFVNQLTRVKDFFGIVLDLSLAMISSDNFHVITKDIRNGSNVLNNYETHKCSANFQYTEAAVWDASDHVIPILQTNSCVPFLCALSDFIQNLNETRLIETFLKQHNIQKYLLALQKAPKYYLVNNWYTRIESKLILNILKMSVSAHRNLETKLFFDIAVKTLCIFNTDQRADVEYLFKNIIFNPQFYSTEMLMESLDVTGRDAIAHSIKNIHDISQIYINILGLKSISSETSENLCLNGKTNNVMPVDWIYTPIMLLQGNESGKTDEQSQTFTITNCLRWIYIYETYFPELAILINPTEKFCRLSCTFLASDGLFLLPEVRNLLGLCLKTIFTNKIEEINFDKNIEGLNSFQDFYTQVLEQYQGVSYGDKLFGNFVMIPLAQRHNVKFRKAVWSEYLGVVQILNIQEDELFYPIDFYLEPAETDLSLLKCYRNAIMGGYVRTTSVLYKIATHHMNAYIKGQKDAK